MGEGYAIAGRLAQPKGQLEWRRRESNPHCTRYKVGVLPFTPRPHKDAQRCHAASLGLFFVLGRISVDSDDGL